MEVDLARNRISLSMRSDPGNTAPSKAKAEGPRKKQRPAKGPGKPRPKAKPAGPKPFNNPFADAFRKASGRQEPQ
jgi:transcriptional accessory protein Tex/SPT6